MYPTKSNPASPCITTCSVRVTDTPKINTVYQHPGTRHTDRESSRQSVATAQTVQSDDGTSQMIWEDSPSSSGSTVSLVRGDDDDDIKNDDDGANGSKTVDVYEEGEEESEEPKVFRPRSPLVEKLKTKLTAWSWEREQAQEERPRWLPLADAPHRRERSSDVISEGLVPPPNTERQSQRSSTRQSEPHTPTSLVECDEEEEELQPIELKVKAMLARPQSASEVPASEDYLSVPRRNSLPIAPTIQRNLSNLDDARFKKHRDSCEFTRSRFHQHEMEGRMNQHLMNSQDSFVLNKTRLNTGGWNRFGGLSPIPDASPPNRSKLRVEIEACNCACPVHCPRYRPEGWR